MKSKFIVIVSNILIVSVLIWGMILLSTLVHELGHAIVGYFLFGEWGEIEVTIWRGVYFPPSSIEEIEASAYFRLLFVGGWLDAAFVLCVRLPIRRRKGVIVYPIKTFLLIWAAAEFLYGIWETINGLGGADGLIVAGSVFYDIVAVTLSFIAAIFILSFKAGELERWFAEFALRKKRK